MIEGLLPLLLVLPIAGFIMTAFFGRRFGKQAHWIPVGAIFLAWVVAMLAVVNVLTGAAPLLPGSETTHGYVVGPWTWIPAGAFHIDLGLFVDPLTACLLIVVTTISRHAVSGSTVNATSTTNRSAGIQVNRWTA